MSTPRRLLVCLDSNLLPSPSSVSFWSKKALAKQNGTNGPELDDATRQRAESCFYQYYQLNSEPDMNAQGPASYN